MLTVLPNIIDGTGHGVRIRLGGDVGGAEKLERDVTVRVGRRKTRHHQRSDGASGGDDNWDNYTGSGITFKAAESADTRSTTRRQHL